MKRQIKFFVIFSLCIALIFCSVLCCGNSAGTKTTENKAINNSLYTEKSLILQNETENTTIDQKEFNTVEILKEQIEEYKELKETTNDDLTKKLNNLIAKTEKLIDYYDNIDNVSLNQLNGARATSLAYPIVLGLVADAIALFLSMGYKLSAELLTESFYNMDQTKTYEPVYGARVVSSYVTADIAAGSIVDGAGEYIYGEEQENSNSRNKNDLALSIGKFDYVKPSADSKKITIIDTYDFGFMQIQTDGLITLPNNVFYEAQEYGIVGPYKVHIEVDMSEPLGIEVLSKSSSTYQVELTNNTGEDIEVVYNEKMCFEDNARNWSGLTDIATVNIAAGESETISVSENGLATDLAFSYIKGEERIVTFAADVSVGNELSSGLSSELSKVAYNNYGSLSIVGKNGSTWIIKAVNDFDEKKRVEYNSKMCFLNDAKTWEGLSDTVSAGTINVGDSVNLYISENGFGDYITVRFTGEEEQNTVFAKDLDINGTMTVDEDIFVFYAYLSLSNAGKSGSAWNIRVTNNSDKSVVVQYNTKMCNKGDAAAWTGLQDVASFTLAAHATKTVSVQTNWFATSIAFSYIHGDGTRVITYADGLSTNGAMNVMHSQV